MANIVLDKVTKRFGRVTAVNELSLDIRDGEFFCVLGPPGAGKTTTLRLIVGLEQPDEGNIIIDGELANEIHPGQHDIAMMFQNLALYPDKTVFDNIAYPLRERKLPKAEIQTRVTAVAKSLYIDHLLQRKPAKLSGGEQQHVVALGRAMVRQPRATLMDKPLANLDTLLRLEIRVELKHRQKGRRFHAGLRDARPGGGHVHGRPDRRAQPRPAPAVRRPGRDLQPAGQPLRRHRDRQSADQFHHRRREPFQR